MSQQSPVFTMIYDLRHAGAWFRAKRDRNVWGVRYTDIAFLDEDHVVLSFYPSPDPSWRRWEEMRKSWILEWVA